MIASEILLFLEAIVKLRYIFLFYRLYTDTRRLILAYGLKLDTDTSFFMAGEWNGGSDDDLGMLRQYHPMDTTRYILNSSGTEGIYDYSAPSGAIDFQNKDSVFVGATSPFIHGCNITLIMSYCKPTHENN